MKYKKVNNKETDSLILSLENLTSEYTNVLNMYNQVQQDLDTFSKSEWKINPYLNQNIQFTTGEIAYVTINGSVYLYSFFPVLNETISTDQTIQSNDQSVVNYNLSVVNTDQNNVNNNQNTVNYDTAQLNQADAAYNQAVSSSGVGFANSLANMFGASNNHVNTQQTVALQNTINNDTAALNEAERNLEISQNSLNLANNNLSASVNNLNVATSNLIQEEEYAQNALNQLKTLGCPSINNVIQVNLPWLSEYSQPYNLIPTNPPLLTMGSFSYENGQIGYTDAYNNSSVVGQACSSINSNLTPPPYDIVNVYNTRYTGNPIMTLPNSTIEVCRASCYSTANCTGATFNSQTNTCNLVSGEGNLQPAAQGVTALVPQITQYLLVLSQLNYKLTEINNQIVSTVNKAESEFVKYTNDDIIDDKLLKNRYVKLIEERKMIDNMINSIEKNQNEETVGSITTNTSYFKYTLLAALTIIFFIILAIITKNSQDNANTEVAIQTSLFFILFIFVIIGIGVYVMNALT